jgi:deoxyribodipyrimidine photo-lyase
MTLHDAATREDGLRAISGFAGRMGDFYAAHRNTEAAAGAHTSGLSPYLRRRMILEEEVVEAARARHGAAAEKFVQEVYWRSYFKGYLELRPWIWTEYEKSLADARQRLGQDPALAARYRLAVDGHTGIDCFDAWAKALVADNWLHNHARMWFASIWIFTLGLDWVLGADFFMRHLLDGDPASNTLSWRWVAGLHTRGKHYVATRENIRRFTGGRYDPVGLNERPAPLAEPPALPARALPTADPAPGGEAALLIHLDDLYPESLDLGRTRIVRVIPLLAHAAGAAEAVTAFDRAAMEDALARAAAFFGCGAGAAEPGLPLVTAWAPVGPSVAGLPPAMRVRRAWDAAVWPFCTAGYGKALKAVQASAGVHVTF